MEEMIIERLIGKDNITIKLILRERDCNIVFSD